MASLRFVTSNQVEQSYAQLMNGPQVVAGTVNECTSGVNTITRASGSYVTAGVRPGALLSGAIAARFPANTYVLVVSALTLTMSANATSSTAGAEGATFTPFVARDEVSPYLMENAMKHDRLLEWQQASGNTMSVDFDLAANRNVALAALLGHRPIGTTGLGISSCVVKYATAATGYPPASGGSWTNATSLTPFSDRDSGALFNQVSARYWRFDLDGVFDAFTLSRFLLNTVNVDLGILGSPGVREERFSPVRTSRTAGQNPFQTFLGDDRTITTLGLNRVPGSLRTSLELIRRQRQSVVMIDKLDTFSEQIIPDAAIRVVRVWELDADTVYDLEVTLEQLG